MKTDNNNNKNNMDSSGVYFSFLVSEQDAQKLNDFGTNQLGLNMATSGNEYETRKHSTLFASREKNLDIDYKKIVEDKKDCSITVTPIGWKLIKSHNTGKTCLALVIHSEELMNSHEEIKSLTGLKHAFSDFMTHISIHYDFELTTERLKDMPLPNFDITLDRLFTKDYHNTDKYKSALATKPEVVMNVKNIREKLDNNNSYHKIAKIG